MRDILCELQTTCCFSQVFENMEPTSPEASPRYRNKIGHLRADYDGYRWWNTWWPDHANLSSTARSQEINQVYESLTAPDAFSSLSKLRQFCDAHPEARVHEQSPDEYNFYYEGLLCWYWIRAITRRGDYNLYIHAFAKEEEQ